MDPRNYSYLDVSALDGVRERLAAGDAALVLPATLDEVIWANGPGAALFGHSGIASFVGGDPELSNAARRQIMATSGFPDIGSGRTVAVRLAKGVSSQTVMFSASGIALPDGERAILLSVADPLAGSRSDDENAARSISGLAANGGAVALIGADGAAKAASAHFAALGIEQPALAELAAELAGEADRLVKRPIATTRGMLPAGIVRLADEPLSGLLMIADEPAADAALEMADDTSASNDAEAPDPAANDAVAAARGERPLPEGTSRDEAPPAEPHVPAPGDDWYFNGRNSDVGTTANTDGDAVEQGDTTETGAIVGPADPMASPVRFVWRTDAESRFSTISDEFRTAFGPEATDLIGRSFADVAEAFGLDPDGEISGLMTRRDTWSGRSVLWPIAGTDLVAPVDLAALPVYSREGGFEGFRGFGIARMGDAVVDTQARGLALLGELPQSDAPDELPIAAVPGDFTAENDDPFHGEVPVLSLGDTPERRDSDKVIRLAERRGQPASKALSSSEQQNFQEIGKRLKDAGFEHDTGPDDADAQPPAVTDDGVSTESEAESAPPHRAASVDADAAAEEGAQIASDDEAGDSAAASDAADTHDDATDRDAAIAGSAIQHQPDAASAEIGAPGAASDDPDRSGTEPDGGARDVPATTADVETDDAHASTADAGPDDADMAEPDATTETHDGAGDEVLSDQTAGGETAIIADSAIESDATEPPAPAEDAPSPGDGAPQAEHRRSTSRAPAGIAAFLPSAFATGTPGDAALGIEPAVLSRLPLPLLIHSGDALHYANREFLNLTGYRSLAELDLAGGLGAIFADPYETDETSDQSMRLRSRDGSEFPVHAFLQSVGWQGGKALLLALRRADRIEMEAAAAPAGDAEARLGELRTIIDTATDGVIIIDNEGSIGSVSRPAEALFGYDSADLVGRPFTSLFAIESQKPAQEYLDGLAGNGVASVLNDGREVIGREAQGRFIPLFMTIGRLPSDSGYCAVLRDITHWKRAEEELTEARSAAERASSQKTEFLARVSHEIRTPLNAIIGFSELMIDEKFGPIGSERYRDYLRDINRSGNHVLDLVNDLLDISKIEAGQQELSYEAVSLNDALGEAVAMMQPQANRERVIIRSSFASRLPDVVADLRSIRQIALNLLSNAIRYTPAGGQVIVSTVYENSGDIAMRVRDTGIGMAAAEIEQALKPFKQINALKRPRGDGTGLGLPLTKAMVEANRARFVIQSTPGEGTLVEIVFPSTRVLAD